MSRTDLDALHLEALRDLAECATKGPWQAVVPNNYAAVRSPSEGCYVYVPPKYDTEPAYETVVRWQNDARFIALSRTAIPALVDEVERVRDIVAEVSQIIESEPCTCGRDDRRHDMSWHSGHNPLRCNVCSGKPCLKCRIEHAL